MLDRGQTSGRVILVRYLTLTREGKTDLAMSNGNRRITARHRKPTSGSEEKTNNRNDGVWGFYQCLF